MDVACLRPSKEARGGEVMAPNVSFSDGQSRKLFDLLDRLHRIGGYSHTFGALDPVQAVQMAPTSRASMSVDGSAALQPLPPMSLDQTLLIIP